VAVILPVLAIRIDISQVVDDQDRGDQAANRDGRPHVEAAVISSRCRYAVPSTARDAEANEAHQIAQAVDSQTAMGRRE